MSERDRIDELLLRASKLGVRLFRNNSGVAFFKDGSTVKYGVAPGGSDCIGWLPVEHQGRRFAVFTAVEMKDYRHKPTHEQQRFLDLVNAAGGIGLWGRSAEEVLSVLAAMVRETG